MLKTKDAVEEWLDQLAPGNTLQSQWTRTTTHLVMTSISLSLKVPHELKLFHLIDPPSLGGELPGFRRANCNARVLPGFRDVSLLQAEAASDISLHPLCH